MRDADGFTLVELMVTLVVAGVILAIAVPAMSDMVRSNRATSQANEVVTAFQYARSEAVKRGAAVTICQSSDQTSCTGSGDWHAGWMILTGRDTTLGAGETRLRVHQGLEGSDLTTESDRDSVTYLPSGRVGAAMTDDDALQLDPHQCEQQQRRQISIGLTGSPRTERQSC